MQDPEDMKLVLISTGVELEDAKLISDLKVQNDDVVGLCYRKEGTEGGCSSKSRSHTEPLLRAWCNQCVCAQRITR